MEIIQIIKALNQSFPAPTQAFQSIVARQTEMIPLLLDQLKYIADNPELIGSGEKVDVILIYFLAKFREKRAFPYIMKLANLPAEWTEEFFGDITTEGLPQLILHTYDGNLQAIKSLVENEQVNVWCRIAGLHNLLGLFATNQLSRPEIIEYYRYLLKTDLIKNETFASSLASDILDFYPQELREELIELIDKGLVDPWMIRDKEEVDEKLALGLEKCLADSIYDAHYVRPLEDIEKETDWLYRKPDRSEFYRKLNVGRNSQCPCDSGKKYKKCCLI